MQVKSWKESKNISAFILLIIAAIVGVFSMYYHEMWRDESQAFLIVRDSNNLAELWQNVRYEGHPFLWYILLFIAYHIFPSIHTIQVLHLLIGLLVVWLIARYSPFTFLEKLLLVFSYYFSYEYLIISRNYSVGIFFLIAAIVYFSRNKSTKPLITAAILLGLSGNANIYSLIISFWLFVYFILKNFSGSFRSISKKKNLLIAVATFLLFSLVAALQLASPGDRTPKVRIAYVIAPEKLDRVFGEVAESMFYLVDFNQNEKYWGSDFFKSNFSSNKIISSFFHHIPAMLALATIVLFIVAAKDRNLRLFFIAGFASLYVFTYSVFDKGFLRHTGAFFILFLAAYWLHRATRDHEKKVDVALKVLFGLMLVLQAVSSAIVHYKDVKYPFTSAKDAASFLKASHRDTGRISIHADFYGMSVVHYAGLNKVFYPVSDSWGSFIRFDTARKPRKFVEIYKMIKRENIQTLIYNNKLPDSVVSKIGIDLIYAPTYNATAPGEDFFIYSRKSQ